MNRIINIKARHKNFAGPSSWEWASRKNTYVAYNRYDTSQKRSFISTFASRSYADARIETNYGARSGRRHGRVPMRTRGLKPVELRGNANTTTSRSYADARIETPCGARGLKHNKV